MFNSLFSCRSIPQGVDAVQNFNADKYLGQWYEIARFDFRFERNMNNTTANYSKNTDGTIKVVNRGYNYVTNEWSEATGKAKFAKTPDVALLKVSFFGPFYAGYNVIALDAEYKYALISGQNKGYLWILSRKKTIPENIRTEYVNKAQNLGYDTSKLIWVKQDA
ncbi:MAG TPA: lipocalin family protein [Bacteroidales bacterium]|nr:lipocalin family protein [Bacteroidales bacterium]